MMNEKQVEQRVEALLKELTLSEKVSLLSGKDIWYTVPVERLRIPSIVMSDGPHGVRPTHPETGRKALYVDEGISYGPARQPITGVTVCWMPDPEAVRAADVAGHELMIHHEALTYPYPTYTEQRERQYLAWPTNAQRLTAIGQAGLTACRIHTSADEICNFRVVIEMLQLGDPAERGRTPFEAVFEIAPMPYRALIDRVKKCFNMPAVRATCALGMERTVSRVGLPWGGLGLFVNVGYMQSVIEHHCDVFIAGETDNYAMRFCTELGIDVIETSHEVSEVPGMAQLAKLIGRAFPSLDVKAYRQNCIWRMA